MNTLHSHFKGLNLLIEPKLKIRPNGRAATRVIPKSFTVVRKPSRSIFVTSKNILIFCYLSAFSHYPARTTPYFCAREARVPSALSSSITSLTFAVNSESFANAIPYSSSPSSILYPRVELLVPSPVID